MEIQHPFTFQSHASFSNPQIILFHARLNFSIHFLQLEDFSIVSVKDLETSNSALWCHKNVFSFIFGPLTKSQLTKEHLF